MNHEESLLFEVKLFLKVEIHRNLGLRTFPQKKQNSAAKDAQMLLNQRIHHTIVNKHSSVVITCLVLCISHPYRKVIFTVYDQFLFVSEFILLFLCLRAILVHMAYRQ